MNTKTRLLSTTVNDYDVAGNYYVAIAINIFNIKDAHYFTPLIEKDGVEMGAYNRAVAWTSLTVLD
jgi:hypothetical protein